MTKPAVTEDLFLGGRLRLCQPASGVRAGSDAVLLAAAVPAGKGETTLELGAGVGAAALALAVRVAGVRVLGLEVQPALAAIARRNAVRNELSGRVRFLAGDLRRPPPTLADSAFDHVFANPPFFAAGTGRRSPDAARAAARFEGATTLADWVAAAGRLTRPGGTITFILRATRRREAARLLGQHGPLAILPLAARAGRAAKRLIMQARADGTGDDIELEPFVLHGDGDDYTAAAEAVLRHGAPLPLGTATRA